MKIEIKIDLELYPDGSIAVFYGDDLVHELKPDEVVSALFNDNTNCEWITKEDTQNFINKMQEAYNERHEG